MTTLAPELKPDLLVVTGVSVGTVHDDKSGDCSITEQSPLSPSDESPATAATVAVGLADLPTRLAAIRTAEAEAWAARDARFEAFHASVLAGLAELREFVAPAWRRVLDHLMSRGGDPA